jgi:hypothetical protein
VQGPWASIILIPIPASAGQKIIQPGNRYWIRLWSDEMLVANQERPILTAKGAKNAKKKQDNRRDAEDTEKHIEDIYKKY